MLRLGLSFAGSSRSYDHYPAALERAARALGLDLEIRWLAGRKAPGQTRLDELDALVFTGGPDVAPERYGLDEGDHRCEDVDRERDRVEFTALHEARLRALPVLAICRGAQLLNVAAGGTLLPHLDGHRGVSADLQHAIRLNAPSRLAEIAGEQEATVNSAHHQAVDRLAPSFRATAYGPDGTIEAFESRSPIEVSPLLAVQWHPERLPDDHPLGGGLLRAFLRSVAEGASP